MAQVINTNITSMMVRRNANEAQSNMATSMERLSSGLRINSAKDDAAGLSISNRFTSELKGNAQAIRNANDGISMAQTAEGALNEVNGMLQRIRELSVQSANGTNSSSDRASLQDEVNQLQQEINRLSENTSFNGQNLLDGSLTKASFQVGANAGQTISMNLGDMRGSALGTNTTTTDNADSGMAVATSATRVDADGAEVGAAQAAAAAAGGNGYTGETLSVVDADGSVVANVTVAANEEASATAAKLDAVDGVSASARNMVELDNWSAGGADAITVTIGSGADSSSLTLAGVTTGSSQDQVFAALRDAVNEDSTLSDAGVTASMDGSKLVLQNADGDDLDITFADAGQDGSSATATVDVSGYDGNAVTLDLDDAAADTTTSGGKVSVTMTGGYSLQSSAGDQTFAEAANTTVTADATNVGLADVTDLDNNAAAYGNNVAEQNVTVVGSDGSATVAIAANSNARGIAEAINAESGTTGVKADASTSATLGNLSTDGTVGFTLYGQNEEGVEISATVTTSDMSALVSAINKEAGSTGITAELGGSGDSIELSLETGENIVISDFTSNAASGPTATDADGTEVSMSVTGGSGAATTVYDGGLVNDGNDSTVVGGEVTFTSGGTFNVFSDVDNTQKGGNSSLFNVAANQANMSELDSVSDIDISTQEGAVAALDVLDGAIAQVDDTRSNLGAIQNRFEVAIGGLDVAMENASAARSRIVDADFAVESSEMTRNQILQQASFSMLAQANQAPQQVLSLLG